MSALRPRAGSELGYVLPSELILDKDFEDNGGKSAKLAAGKIMKVLDARGKLKHEASGCLRPEALRLG